VPYYDAVLPRPGTTGTLDWITDFAGRLPMDVISELMGVPEPDRDEVRALADLVVHREEGVYDVPEAGMKAALDLVVYYTEMLAAAPPDSCSPRTARQSCRRPGRTCSPDGSPVFWIGGSTPGPALPIPTTAIDGTG